MTESKPQLFQYNYQNQRKQYNNSYKTKNKFSKPNPKIEKNVNYLPIVYHSYYDISFCGFQKLHPFDCQKWGKTFDLIHDKLKGKVEKCLITLSPKRDINTEELELVHTKKFVEDIHNDKDVIAKASEVWLLRWCPVWLINRQLLIPLKYQTSGSILAAHQALTKGYAINIGGGFHHCSHTKAEGFCLFADITLIMEYLWANHKRNLNFMIIDLDAHQGNGYERDLLSFSNQKKDKVYVLDVFNADIYPNDMLAKTAINCSVVLHSFTEDNKYMELLDKNLKKAMNEFKPNLIIYNAGTDILKGDPLGRLNVSAEAIIQRDHKVFTFAKQNKVPIVMLTSGGYQYSNAEIIASSIVNLYEDKLIDLTCDN